MPHREIHDSATFLPDILSQRLCLQDALASRSPSAMLHALQAVASARGPARLARETELTQAELAGLLAGVDGQDPERITELVRALLARITPARAGLQSAKMAKTGRAASKTGLSGKP